MQNSGGGKCAWLKQDDLNNDSIQSAGGALYHHTLKQFLRQSSRDISHQPGNMRYPITLLQLVSFLLLLTTLITAASKLHLDPFCFLCPARLPSSSAASRLHSRLPHSYLTTFHVVARLTTIQRPHLSANVSATPTAPSSPSMGAFRPAVTQGPRPHRGRQGRVAIVIDSSAWSTTCPSVRAQKMRRL